MTTNEIIRLENIRRNFIVGSETVHALRGVNFTINSGEFVTIMGTSGRVLPRWYFGSEYG